MGEGAKRTRLFSVGNVNSQIPCGRFGVLMCFFQGTRHQLMFIGAHVSIAGGLPNAVARAIELECDSLQIFNQSPRAWRPQNHSDEAIAEFREGIEASRIEAVLIHAVYLINAASLEDEVRSKSLRGAEGSARAGRPDRRGGRRPPPRLAEAAGLREVHGRGGARRSASAWPRPSAVRSCSRTLPAPAAPSGATSRSSPA